jgi:hypothetical protein
MNKELTGMIKTARRQSSSLLRFLLTWGNFLFLTSSVNAASVYFDFNTSEPFDNGSLTPYGSANWQPTGGTGAATNASDGYFEMTPSLGSQRGAVVFADFDNGAIIGAFTFEADVRIGNGSLRPADGISINYVRAYDPLLKDISGGGDPSTDGNVWATGPNGEENLPEEGTQTGISIGFDTWESGGSPPYYGEADQSVGPDIVGIYVRVDGNLELQFPMPTLNGACDDPTSIQTGWTGTGGPPYFLCWAHLKLVLDTNAMLSVQWKNTLIITNFQTSYKPAPGRLVLGGRTAAGWEFHHLDNIAISTSVLPPSLRPAGFVTNGGFQIQLSGQAGKSYVIEGTTNLLNWASLSTNIAPSDIFTLMDPKADQFPCRFYRAVELR